MYRVKNAWLIILITGLLALVSIYFVNTNNSIKSGYKVDVVGNLYISTDETFSYEFTDQNTVYKYTVDRYDKLSYLYTDGVFRINEYEIELEGIALNNGKEFYVITTDIYMILAN